AWANAPRTTTSEAAGFHVRRAGFDRVLRHAAAGAPAQVVAGAVRRVESGDPSRVTYAAPGGELIAVHARQGLDCSGRTGGVAARGFRRRVAPYRTIALPADWHADAWPEAEQTHTLVESCADGWAWSVPLS